MLSYKTMTACDMVIALSPLTMSPIVGLGLLASWLHAQ